MRIDNFFSESLLISAKSPFSPQLFASSGADSDLSCTVFGKETIRHDPVEVEFPCRPKFAEMIPSRRLVECR